MKCCSFSAPPSHLFQTILLLSDIRGHLKSCLSFFFFLRASCFFSLCSSRWVFFLEKKKKKKKRKRTPISFKCLAVIYLITQTRENNWLFFLSLKKKLIKTNKLNKNKSALKKCSVLVHCCCCCFSEQILYFQASVCPYGTFQKKSEACVQCTLRSCCKKLD